MGSTVRAYVALGSNLGDALGNLRSACDALRALSGCSVMGQSTFHCTAPVGGPVGQPDFWNAVIALDTCLGPLELLDELQGLEAQFGRDRSQEERWGPRTLDLDLLLHGAERCATERLELPHPRMHERSFVLEPLAELAPELLLADGTTVEQRCAALKVAALQP